tara:strand:+ start:200 stop:610 length:411 start_codon:yes stop_codon:yes gene_type:complete
VDETALKIAGADVERKRRPSHNFFTASTTTFTNRFVVVVVDFVGFVDVDIPASAAGAGNDANLDLDLLHPSHASLHFRAKSSFRVFLNKFRIWLGFFDTLASRNATTTAAVDVGVCDFFNDSRMRSNVRFSPSFHP